VPLPFIATSKAVGGSSPFDDTSLLRKMEGGLSKVLVHLRPQTLLRIFG
jgi:hypothetical protein